MKIKLDDTHYLESDQFNIWISAHRTSENGKKYTRNVTGYYRDIESLIDDYIDRSFLASKATSFTALRRDLKAIKKQVSEWEDVLNITLDDINSLKEKKRSTK